MGKIITGFYFALHLALKQASWESVNTNPVHIINTWKARRIIGNGYNIPKNMQVSLLKEMEARGYIKFLNKQKIEVK
jgi:hypothetical protein